MSLLNILAAHHKEWIKMAYKFGAGAYAEDIVQEMYLRLNKYVDDPERIMYGDEPNKLFVWVTLRNMVRKYQDKKDLLVFVEEYHDHEDYAEDMHREDEETLDRFLDTIFDKAREMHWFDYKMFELYHTTELSMRDIEKETTISLRTIFTTLNKAKDYVRENLYEEYEEYKKEIRN